MSDKIYIGSGKVTKTQYGDLTKISFTAEDIKKLQDNLSNGWVNLVLKEKKNKVEGKPTHYLEVDTWKPIKDKDGSTSVSQYQQADNDSLPF